MRAPTAIVATALTAAAIVASWTAGAQAPPALGARPATTGPAVPGSVGGSAPKTPAPGVAPPTASSGPSATSSPNAPAAGTRRQVDGQVVMTDYGPVQVRVVLVGTRIQDVAALQLTDSSGRSVRISAGAEPILRQEAVAAQSSRIDTVSGATFTSDGYRQSLQSALDAAHV